jgi:2-oxoglutarate dehydrogenase E1 component
MPKTTVSGGPSAGPAAPAPPPPEPVFGTETEPESPPAPRGPAPKPARPAAAKPAAAAKQE